MAVLDGIIRELRLPRPEIRCFHTLRVTPIGVRHDAEEAVILQAVNDIPAGSNDKLVLIDIEIHFHPLPSGLVVPTAASRKVLRVNPTIHRNQILLQLGYYDYCQFLQNRCIMHTNHLHWAASDRTVHHIHHLMILLLTLKLQSKYREKLECMNILLLPE